MICMWTLVASSILWAPKSFLRKHVAAPLSMALKSSDLAQDSDPKIVEVGHVYFVATPIGNLGDITHRAVQVLSEVDVICAEDTRHTKKLLNHLNLTHKKLLSHHEFNHLEQIPKILAMVAQGQSIAVVSDAGTPGISDPGQQLAEACAKAQIPIHPLPGPSAVIAAISISGFSGSVFSFHGFLPVKGKSRAEKLTEIASLTHTVSFFEAPHRIKETLSDLRDKYNQGQRLCVCCRELTKLHEEIWRGTIDESMQWMDKLEDNERSRVRGEFTVVLGPSLNTKVTGQALVDDISSALQRLKGDGVSRSEAVKMVSSMLDTPKTTVYKIALEESWD